MAATSPPLLPVAYLPAVYCVLGGHHFVGHLGAFEHHEAKPSRAPIVPIVADKGLPHHTKVLKIRSQTLARRFPAQAPACGAVGVNC